jgi:Tfp pilus assembly protein PilO
MKLSKEKQQHLIAVVVGVVVVVVAVYFLIVIGQREKLAKLDQEIAAVNDLVVKAERDFKNEPAKLENLADATNELAQLESSMMPTNEVYSTFLATFNQFREQYRGRIDINVISRERQAPLGMLPKFPYNTAIFNIRGLAYYHDFGRFMADLETQFPFYRVKQFSLSPGGLETTVPEKLVFELEIVTLVKPNP